MRRLLALSVLAAVVTACGGEDGPPIGPIVPTAPIVLVLSDAFEPPHHRLAAAAAEGWNVEVGTHLRVGEPTEGEQVVTVDFSDPSCTFGGGKGYLGYASAIRGDAVFICPDAINLQPMPFLAVMEHEIGHVLGLEHLTEPSAVMYGPEEGEAVLAQTAFTLDDRVEFARVNPGFEVDAPCDIQHDVVPTGTDGGAFVRDEAGSTFLVATEDALESWSIDDEANATGPEARLVDLTTYTGGVVATRLASGDLDVTWNGPRYVQAGRFGAEARTSERIELGDDAFVTSTTIDTSGRRTVAFGVNDARRTQLAELDETGDIATSTVVESLGVVVAFGDAVAFVGLRLDAPGAGTLVAARVDAGLVIGDWVDLASMTLPDPDRVRLPVVAALEDGLFVSALDVNGTTFVRTDSDLLARVVRRLDDPIVVEPYVLERDGELIIAASWWDEDIAYQELYVGPLERDTLEEARPFARVTTPDAYPAGALGLKATRDGLLVPYVEGLGRLRARCLAWP